MAAAKFEAVRLASQQDPELAAALESAASIQEWVGTAKAHGFDVDVADLPTADVLDHELSDAELSAVSGGAGFPRTDWLYCDNPWTDWHCTMNC